MAELINIKINDKPYSVPQGMTILKACERVGIHVPTLCFMEHVSQNASCSVCVVEVKGAKSLIRSCVGKVMPNMEVFTNTPLVRKARKTNVELLLANHPKDCQTCVRNQNCELQEVCMELRITDNPFRKTRKRDYPIDQSSVAIVRDPNKCILCRRCAEVCANLQGVFAIDVHNRGFKSTVGAYFEKGLGNVACINCGQCVAHCPTGALTEKSHIEQIWAAIDNPEKVVVVQTAPAIRAALGEEFGYPVGTSVTKKMARALKLMGFDYIFDTQFTADLTIMEEGYELLTRLKSALVDKKNVALPMTTSCSPGWIKFMEHFFPNLLPNISTCKSPQQMMGALIKTYWAKKMGVDPANVVSVSVMPCTAKKFEASRPEMASSGFQDVDYVLTTRELAAMIKQVGIELKEIEDDEFDDPLGQSTGAGTIFAATGGVMEAALRTAYEVVTGREVPFENLDITPVRGMEGVREASVKIENPVKDWEFLNGVTLKVLVSYGTANARQVMEKLSRNELDCHFIEIMTCPGGCLGGGGQPLPVTEEKRELRAKAIYNEDTSMKYRKSHENPAVIKIYEDFLERPNSHKSHELLHTHYLKRGPIK